jgi:hypothetical protein
MKKNNGVVDGGLSDGMNGERTPLEVRSFGNGLSDVSD